MRIRCKNYDLMFIVNFMSWWYGSRTRLSEIPREKLAGILEKFFGG